MNSLERISFIADMLQFVNYQLNTEQTSNDQLMKELRNQDQILDEQTNMYLKKIIEQNQEIINLLKKGDKDA